METEETGGVRDKQPSHISYTPSQDPSHTCSLSPKPNAPLRLEYAISGPQVSKQLVVRFELRFRSGESIVRGECDIGGGWRGFGDRCGRGRAGCSGRCCGLFELRCWMIDMSATNDEMIGLNENMEEGEGLRIARHGCREAIEVWIWPFDYIGILRGF